MYVLVMLFILQVLLLLLLVLFLFAFFFFCYVKFFCLRKKKNVLSIFSPFISFLILIRWTVWRKNYLLHSLSLYFCFVLIICCIHVHIHTLILIFICCYYINIIDVCSSDVDDSAIVTTAAPCVVSISFCFFVGLC